MQSPGRRVRLPTRDELAHYAKPGHACQGSGVVVVRPRGGDESATLACRCAAKRMVRRHPGAFLAADQALFIDLDLEAAAQAEAAQ